MDSLTLNSLGALVQSNGHFLHTEEGYKHMDSEVADECGNTQTGPSHWVLMTKDVLPGSKDKSYQEQQAIVAALRERSGLSYVVPKLLPATACIFMNYLTSPQDARLFLFSTNPWTLTRCQPVSDRQMFMIGWFDPDGFEVFGTFGYPHDCCGVAVLREFRS
jgi:hypothetical protein